MKVMVKRIALRFIGAILGLYIFFVNIGTTIDIMKHIQTIETGFLATSTAEYFVMATSILIGLVGFTMLVASIVCFILEVTDDL